MSAALEPGMKVECIMDLRPRAINNEAVPVVGSIYTVREVEEFRGQPALRLVEIVNKNDRYIEGLMECLFWAGAFRPVKQRDQNIEQFRELVRTAKAEDFLLEEVDA